jgi:hypothetical protein
MIDAEWRSQRLRRILNLRTAFFQTLDAPNRPSLPAQGASLKGQEHFSNASALHVQSTTTKSSFFVDVFDAWLEASRFQKVSELRRSAKVCGIAAQKC